VTSVCRNTCQPAARIVSVFVGDGIECDAPALGERLSSDERRLELDNGMDQIHFKGEAGVKCELKWKTRFVPDDGGPVTDVLVITNVVATGKPETLGPFPVAPPETNGHILLVMPEFVGCSDCTPGAETCENGSVDFSVSLRRASNGHSAGSLSIYEPLPTNTLATLAALRYDLGADVWLNYTSTNHQIVAPETVADICVMSSAAYEIRLYHPTDFTNLLARPNGDPFGVQCIFDTRVAAKVRSHPTVDNKHIDGRLASAS
jgi:hypothetical protein